jgi:hypothetical protein
MLERLTTPMATSQRPSRRELLDHLRGQQAWSAVVTSSGKAGRRIGADRCRVAAMVSSDARPHPRVGGKHALRALRLLGQHPDRGDLPTASSARTGRSSIGSPAIGSSGL